MPPAQTPRSASLSVDYGRGGVELPERIGPFRIVGVLGHGGMGVVFDAVSPSGQPVALKLIRPQGDPEVARLVIQRFLREAKILKKLNHPAIVRLVDAGDLSGLLYLAMQRIEGRSLLAIRRKGPIDFDMLVALGAEICDALGHMHEAGVIHRDIKPANVIVDNSGRPIITDFGISAAQGATGITRHGDLLGSPGFMAPEIVEGELPTALADQFALGRVLFELAATGVPPKLPLNAPIFELLAASLKIEWSRLPQFGDWPEAEKVLRRMLAHRPADRFPNALAARDAFRALRVGSLLDFDTIGEHVERLALPLDTPWADSNAHLHTPADPPDAGLTPPSGGRPNEDPTQLDMSVAELAQALEAARRDDGQTTATSADPLDLVGAPLTEQDADEPTNPREPAPLELGNTPAIEEVTAAIPLGGASRSVPPAPRSLAPAPLEAPRLGDPATAPRLRLSAPDNPNFVARPLSEMLERPRESVPPPEPRPEGERRSAAASGEPTAVAEPIVGEDSGRLRREIQALRSQLKEARVRPPEPSRTWPRVALALVLGLAGGAGLGLWVAGLGARPLPPLVLVATTAKLAPPTYQYPAGRVPSRQDVEDGKNMLDSAALYLERRDMISAERYLGLCVEVADLPECHRALGTLYAFAGNPKARAHFEHYLRIAPAAEDAAQIRAALGDGR